MKKILILTVVMLFVAGTAFGDSILNSKHDLSVGSTSSGYVTTVTDEICVFCHTPHNAGTLIPLWNHATTATVSFDLYTSPNSTLNASLKQPSGTSKACLSCHDGTETLAGGIVNQPNGGNVTAGVDAGGVVSDKISGGNTDLGTNLSTTHPISFTYDGALVTADGGLKNPLTLTYAKLLGATGDQVECGSCHKVHDPANVPFLRVANTNSQLCLDCHDK